MRSSCEGYRKAGNFLSSLLHLVSIDWKWESLFFFFSFGGNVSTVPSKENTGYFQERHSLLGGLSPGLTFLWESFPNSRAAVWNWVKKQHFILYHACICLKSQFCAGQSTDFSHLIKHDLFLKLYKFLKRLLQARVEASTRARPQSYWVHPYASDLRSRDGSLPPALHPSRKKSGEEGDICLYQKSKIFASSPQWIATNIS